MLSVSSCSHSPNAVEFISYRLINAVTFFDTLIFCLGIAMVPSILIALHVTAIKFSGT